MNINQKTNPPVNLENRILTTFYRIIQIDDKLRNLDPQFSGKQADKMNNVARLLRHRGMLEREHNALKCFADILYDTGVDVLPESYAQQF